MKVHVLLLSKVFPAWHPKKGQSTFFKEKLLAALNKDAEWNYPKKHTMRANYKYWRKIFDDIDKGDACLSIRQWSGLPYRSKQVEIVRLTKKDGIGLQRIDFLPKKDGLPRIDAYRVDFKKPDCYNYEFALNDGLGYDDWLAWFNNYDLYKPMAIIQFTKFRY